MHRALLAIVVLSLVAGCSAPDAAPPEEDASAAPPAWTPPPPPTAGSVDVGVGDTWRYAAPDGNNTVRIVGASNGTLRVQSTLEREGERPAVVTTVMDARTLAIISLQDPRFGVDLNFVPPLPIVIPAEDHTYEGKIVVQTFLGQMEQPATGQVTFYGLENVSTPAGTFAAYHYAAHLRSEGAFPFEQTRELWFSPEVRQAVRLITDNRTEELTGWELQGD